MKKRFAFWYICYFAALGSQLPFLSLYFKGEGWHEGDVALLLLLFPIGALCSGPVWGWLGDRFARAHWMLWLASWLTVACAWPLVGVTRGVWLVLLLAGFALMRAPLLLFVDTLTVKFLGDEAEEYGRIRLWGSLSFLLMAFGMGWWIQRWPLAPMVVGAALLTCAACVVHGLPKPSVLRTPTRLTWSMIWSFWRDPVLFPFWLVCIAQSVNLSIYNYLYALHIEKLGLPATVTSASIACGVCVEIGLLSISPWLLRRIGARHLLLLSVFAGVPRWFLTGTVTSAVGLIAIQSLHGVVFGLWWIACIAVVEKHAPDHIRYMAQSFLTALTQGLGALLAMGVAWAVLHTLSSQVLFLAMAGLSLAASFYAALRLR